MSVQIRVYSPSPDHTLYNRSPHFKSLPGFLCPLFYLL